MVLPFKVVGGMYSCWVAKPPAPPPATISGSIAPSIHTNLRATHELLANDNQTKKRQHLRAAAAAAAAIAAGVEEGVVAKLAHSHIQNLGRLEQDRANHLEKTNKAKKMNKMG